MKKCEWKGIKTEGQSTEWKFYPCDNFEPIATDGNNVECGICNVDISKPELEPPTHEEILTKWWRNGNKSEWFKIVRYSKGKYYPLQNGGFLRKIDFIGIESADIPPEETE